MIYGFAASFILWQVYLQTQLASGNTTISKYVGDFVYRSQNRDLLLVQNFLLLLIFATDSIGIPFGARHSLLNC